MRQLCAAVLVTLTLCGCHTAGAEVAARSSISPRFFGSPPPNGLSVDTAIAKAVDYAIGSDFTPLSADAGPWDELQGSSLKEYDGWVWVVRMEGEMPLIGCPGHASCAVSVHTPMDVFIDYLTGDEVEIAWGSVLEDR